MTARGVRASGIRSTRTRTPFIGRIAFEDLGFERLNFGRFKTYQKSLADIAQLAGSSRESASRFLAVLERAGVVTQGRGRVTVHDRAALQRYIY